MQHVEELGHSNWLPGHWMAPKGLVSVDRMTQDSTNTVSEELQAAGPTPPATRVWGAGTKAQALYFKSSAGYISTDFREKGERKTFNQLPPVHALTGDRTNSLGMCPGWESNLQ